MGFTQSIYSKMSALAAPIEIGTSELGAKLYAYKFGRGGRRIIITSAMHARECYGALVTAAQAQSLHDDPPKGEVYIVPVVNPDGSDFFDSGVPRGEYLKANTNKRYIWKANALGVDLNCNFDARFGTGKSNKRVAGASDYIGEYPHSASETLALVRFTKEVMPDMTISYHAMGGELYWEFFQSGERRSRDEKLARLIANRIGVKKVDGDLGSAGGYKDYCISKLSIPAVTIELVSYGEHPLSPQDFAPDLKRNYDLPQYVLGLLEKL